MAPPLIETVRDLCSRGRWNNAADLLAQLDAGAAADFMMTLPFEEQRALFRALPLASGAPLVGHFPYFHAFVLLHSRPALEMSQIVDAMNPADRDLFFDALPEEAWQSLMNELEATKLQPPQLPVETGAPGEAILALPRTATPEHIIEAR